MKIDGCSALITGASAGIGREFSRQLAMRSRTLVLIARREERLNELRDELQNRNAQLNVHVRVVDLCDTSQIDELIRWLDQNKIHILFQIGLSKHPDLPTVPLIMDLARTAEERAIFKVIFGRQMMAWPFTAPPGVPKERISVLRDAFMDTMKDKEFLAEAAKAGLEIRPVSGVDIQKLVHEVYDTPAAVVQRTAQLLQ